MRFIVCLLLTSWLCVQVQGHGYLAVPGARNSMWRLGFNTPKNYNDMGLNCGGKENQWSSQGGKCGLCGDPFQNGRPRAHEAGGAYAPVDRPISRCYNQNANVMDITVRITAHHMGYLEFRLCENNNMLADPEASCIDNGRLLTIAGTNQTRYSVETEVKEFYKFQLMIPIGVTCTQCILHWKYNAGNSWGCDETGCDNGAGPQEQFINCADIAILPDCSIMPPTPSTPVPPPSSAAPTWAPPTAAPTGTAPTLSPCSTSTSCRAVGPRAGDPVVDRWCNANCANPMYPYCPITHCACDTNIYDEIMKVHWCSGIGGTCGQ